MKKSVPRPRSTRKPYSRRELDLMAAASTALLGGPVPDLSAEEWDEAEVLLEGLPEPEDDGPHEPLCPCWRCAARS